MIKGIIADNKYITGDIPFINLDNLTNDIIVSGIPDLYHGA